MKDCNYKPDGTGKVMGDTKGLPDRGTSTGMSPGAEPFLDGQSVDQDSTNSLGKITGATKSDKESTSFGGDDRV